VRLVEIDLREFCLDWIGCDSEWLLRFSYPSCVDARAVSPAKRKVDDTSFHVSLTDPSQQIVSFTFALTVFRIRHVLLFVQVAPASLSRISTGTETSRATSPSL
jgi:hypothetical protein